jgi:hypothetical protein
MRRIVLGHGVASGLVISAMLLATVPFLDRLGFDLGAVLGYASMVAASLFVYAGVRRYRDTVAGGTIGFGRAFGVGMLVVAVASLCYTATWQAMYARIGPEFMARYQAHALEQTRADGASEAELERKRAELARYAELYRNPAVNAAITFLEPLPVGVLAALATAAVLGRRRRESAARTGLAAVG